MKNNKTTMTLLPIPKFQWPIFLSLYITQFVGVSFMFVALIGILRQRGMALEDLSIVYVMGIPWALKFLWAPLIDHFGYKRWGQYRGWLLILQLLMVVSLLVLSQLSLDNQLNLIVIMGTLFVAISATQDIAVDALASREFDEKQRGFINGIQITGNLIGNVIGGGLVLFFYSDIGWHGAFYLMAGVVSISWFQLLFFREKNTAIKHRSSMTKTFKQLATFWRGKGLWASLLFVSTIGFSMIYGILTPMMSDAGKTLSEIGLALNVFGTCVGIVTGIFAGWLIQKFGRKVTLKNFYGMQLLCFFMILPVGIIINNYTLYLTLTVYYIVYPLIVTIMTTLMMDYATQDKTPGTDYTVQYTVSVFSHMLMAGMGLQIAEHFDYIGVIITTIFVGILALILALRFAKKLPNSISSVI